jgi:hypothetical protein
LAWPHRAASPGVGAKVTKKPVAATNPAAANASLGMLNFTAAV